MSDGFVYVNGIPLPYPSSESGLQTVLTLVDSARTADGVFRGKKIGRDQRKIEMTWAKLTPLEWSNILKIFDQNFTFNLRYFSMVDNSMVEGTFYVGDRTAQPFKVNTNTNRPLYYLNCQANLVDTGA